MAKRTLFRAGLAGAALTLLSTPAFARTVELKEAGTAFWAFLIIGSVIVLLQLIPAGVLFVSFISTTTQMVFKKEKGESEEVAIPGAEPVAIKR